MAHPLVPVTVLIHTLNEETNLPWALRSVVDWADQVVVIDSESTDHTVDIAKEHGVEVFSRRCKRSGLVEQRNWALANLPIRHPWIFVLDADEYLEESLKEEIAHTIYEDDPRVDGYWCRFRFVFMGRWLKKVGMYPTWSLRLFRAGKVYYEKRDVNSHPLVDPDRAAYLTGHFVNHDRRSFSAELTRLDEFSTLEAQAYRRLREGRSQEELLSARLWGSKAERRRFLKSVFIRLPARPVVIFVYLYLLRCGFLEGRQGFDYALLKAIGEWAITVKMRERREAEVSSDTR